MKLPDGDLVAHVNSGETGMLYRDIFIENCYLRHGIELSAGDVVLDVGANIGMATMYFHRQAPGITVHGFEPAPEPFEALEWNMERHRIQGAAHRVALSDKPGIAEFVYYPRTTVMSGLHADASADSKLTRDFLHNSGFDDEDIEEMLDGKYAADVIQTQISTLSEQIAELGIETIGLLKLDVEKSELDVLRGLDERDWPRIRQMVMEVHGAEGRLERITTMLEDRGFRTVVVQDELLEGTQIFELFAVR